MGDVLDQTFYTIVPHCTLARSLLQMISDLLDLMQSAASRNRSGFRQPNNFVAARAADSERTRSINSRFHALLSTSALSCYVFTG